MNSKLITTQGIADSYPICKQTIYRRLSAGTFPKPLPFSKKGHFWKRETIENFFLGK